MDDDDARATLQEPSVEPGVIAADGSIEFNSEQVVSSETILGVQETTVNVATTKPPPERISQAERDVLTKQYAANTKMDGQMKPGAVAVGGTQHAPNTSIPGATHQDAPSSRLAAKLRGELPENWDTAAPAVATLESREDLIESKIRASGPQVNSNLMDRENRVQSKIRSSETSTSMPGAIARLSNLEDAVTSKQDDDDNVKPPPSQLRQREDLTAAKSEQVTLNLDDAPKRLQQVEDMLDVKMRDSFPANNADRASKLAGNETMEYGEFGGPNEGSLAVAFAVDEEAGADGAYLPAAVEYDPDAKPPLYRSRRFRLYSCLALIAVIVGTIGAVLGFLLTSEDNEVLALNIQYRETLGIREHIELAIGSAEKLDDLSSPYRKALDWIIFSDLMVLTPDSDNLIQRYIAVYFFYATSAKKPWTFGCNPPLDGERETCNYDYIQRFGSQSSSRAMRWLSNSNECNWAGIKCDDLLQIRDIDLSGTDLTGTFPEGIIKLPFLQFVRLAHGELDGPLPEFLADAKHLVWISLENNTFTGTFPDRWLESRSFQLLELFDNGITGTIPQNITKLKDLKHLDVQKNSLEGSIPQEIGSVRNLVDLKLEQNLLTGTIPTELGSLAEMEGLFLGRNKLTGTIPTEIGLMKRLFWARLQVNLLTGPVPESFWNSDNLTYVDLFENKLNGTLSGEIGRLSNLLEISVSNNLFTGSLPARIASGSARVRKIIATGNNLNGTVAPQICDIRENRVNLETLEVDCKVPIGGGTPEISCPAGCCTLCCDSDGSCIEG